MPSEVIVTKIISNLELILLGLQLFGSLSTALRILKGSKNEFALIICGTVFGISAVMLTYEVYDWLSASMISVS